MKKQNNKGFSLVELIVVVAIMAVLVGVLAPAYLRYVEKSRIQKDRSAVAEVVEAVKIALSEEKVYDEVEIGGTNATTVVITIADGEGTISCDADALEDAVIDTVGDTITVSSKLYKECDSYTITINSQTSVTGEWDS